MSTSARIVRRFCLSLLALLVAYAVLWPASVRAAWEGSHDIARSGASQAAQARPYKAALQIGHYKNNELPSDLSDLIGHTGAVGGGRTELELNIDVANRVAKILRGQGMEVALIPATVPTGYTADVFVALHADGSSSPATRGFKISTRWRSEVAVQDALLTELLTEAYRAATALPEDGNVTRNMRGYYAYSPWRPTYRVSNFTPGAIVEMGFVTSPADRAVMFGSTDKVTSGIATGIAAFLKQAYGTAGAKRSYGYGIVDKDVDLSGKPRTPVPRRGNGQPSRTSSGDWQLYLMGKPTISVYASPGKGSVVATLAKGQFQRSLLREGDYYQVTLPNGKTGWIHRNSVITQM